ncbi:HigA family addiction module antidote protein, partial [Salmonella enterica subsp. enterica]
LAEILHVHRNTVSALVNNNRKLTMDMAYRLAKAFDTSVDFWINLQTAVDLWEVENDMRVQEELSRINTAEKFISQRNLNKKAA